MSDRRVVSGASTAPVVSRRWLAATLLVSALLVSAGRAEAQTLDDWRARQSAQAVRAKQAAEAYASRDDQRRVFDALLEVGPVRFSYARGDLSASDTVRLRTLVEGALAQLRERYGDAGTTLLAGAHWSIEKDSRFRRPTFVVTRVGRGGDRSWFAAPARARDIEELLLNYGGERLSRQVEALRAYGSWTALRPSTETFAEVGRRLATSWSGTARRCASGAVDSCTIMLTPFDPASDPSRYYDPGDLRAVVAAARLPSLTDSTYFKARRQCLDGADSVCQRIIDRIDLPDPFNLMVRGTALTVAIELGGRDALARALDLRQAPGIPALATVAGVPPDSLVRAWMHRVDRALAEERGATTFPVSAASIGWAALLLLLATRRRFQ